MDVRCQVCAEPFEAYHIQNDITEEEKEFFTSGQGCDYCKGIEPPEGRPEMAILSGYLFETLGDDLDAIASETSELEYYGYG